MVTRAAIETSAIVVATIAIPTAAILLSPGTTLPTLAGVVGGVPAGVLVAWLISLRQRPDILVTAVPGGTVGQQDTYWIHLKVENRTSGFLGMGTAHEARAKLRLPNGKMCDLKWSSKPDPIEMHPVGTPSPTGWIQLTNVLNPHLFDPAKTETIRPTRSRDLGIAFKMKGDPNSYVHQPESFRFRDWKDPECRLPAAPQTIVVTLEYDEGESEPFSFVISNDGSTEVPSADSTLDHPTLRVAPA